MYETDKKCQKCKNNGSAICSCCDMFYSEFDPIDEPKRTNYDYLRVKSIEEMAEYLRWHSDPYYRNGMDWLDWLKAEVEDNG